MNRIPRLHKPTTLARTTVELHGSELATAPIVLPGLKLPVRDDIVALKLGVSGARFTPLQCT